MPQAAPSSFKLTLRCARCGTVQEVELGDHHVTCKECAQRLGGPPAAPHTPGSTVGRAAPRFQPTPQTRQVLAELHERGPGSEVLDVMVDLLTFHGRLTWLGSFVPFLGPWLVARSDLARDPKRKLQWVAAGTTLLAVVGIVSAWQPLSAPPVPLPEQVQAELGVLADIAGAYRDKHGAYPDAATWKRTADQPDLRFFDPWSRPYGYVRTHDGGATIGTLGRDGAPGGSGEDADLSIHLAPPEPPAAPGG